MATAKKINHDDDELPPVPSQASLKLVSTQGHDANGLPQPPSVRVGKDQVKHNSLLIVLTIFSFGLMISMLSAGFLYLVINGSVEVKPTEIKAFLKSLRVK